MKKASLVLVVIAIILLGAGVLAWAGMDSETPDPAPTPTASTDQDLQPVDLPTKTENTTTNTEPTETTGTTTITYDGNNFNPSKLTVKAGSEVTVRNNSSKTIEFASDPHPVHTSNQELNANAIPAGQSTTFKVSKIGTFGFHDHLNPSKIGTIVVQ